MEARVEQSYGPVSKDATNHEAAHHEPFGSYYTYHAFGGTAVSLGPGFALTFEGTSI